MTCTASTALVLTGLPASGKSTYARVLAEALGWPCFDKDDFLEALYRDALPTTPDQRRGLSRRSDDLFRDAAVRADNSVLVSHWASARGPAGTGTGTGWIDAHFARVIEIYCACSPETAAQRFTGRNRHPGHLDHLRPPEQVVAQMKALAPGFPLALWELISVNTESPKDAGAQQALIAEVRGRLS